MEHHIFRHLGREWEAAILAATGDEAPVRFRSALDTDPHTYEGRIAVEELDGPDDGGRDLALRRSLESALVTEALAGRHGGLTAEEVADRTGMPVEATEDRLHKLEVVEPVPDPTGPRRYRISEPPR
jgi:hypothetical protein